MIRQRSALARSLLAASLVVLAIPALAACNPDEGGPSTFDRGSGAPLGDEGVTSSDNPQELDDEGY